MPSWILVVVGAIVLWWLFRRLARRTDPVDAWRQLAEATGLRYESSSAGPGVRGRYRDTEVRLSTERPAGASPVDEPSTIVQAEIQLPGTTGVWGATSHRLRDGADPWTRPGRDALALVRQHNSRPVVDALTRPPVRERVVAFLTNRPEARISDDWVTLTLPRRVRERAALQRLLDEVVGVSRLFRDETADPWAGMRDGARPTAAPTGASSTPGAPPETGRDDLAPRGRPNPYTPPEPRPPSAATGGLPTPTAADPHIATRWRRRTAVAYLAGLTPAGLGACLAILGGLRYDTAVFGLQGVWWIAIGGAIFGLGILVFLSQYRCPSCGQLVRSRRTGHLVFDPKHCPHCHVQLRD